MTTRDTRLNFLKLLDDTWPGVRSEFVAAMRQARAGVDMKALEAAIGRGDVDAAFRALRFDAADLFKTDTAIDGVNWPVQEVIPMDSAGFVISWLVKVSK